MRHQKTKVRVVIELDVDQFDGRQFAKIVSVDVTDEAFKNCVLERIARDFSQEYAPGGYIYFGKTHLFDPKLKVWKKCVKVGVTTNVKRRVSQLGIELIKVFPFHSISEARRQELFLHKQFFRYRFEGEWYELPQPLVDGIQSVESIRDLEYVIGKEVFGHPSPIPTPVPRPSSFDEILRAIETQLDSE